MLADLLSCLRALLPSTRREGVEFVLDLSPLIGILVFHENPQKLYLLLGVEFLFLQGWIALRILLTGLGRLGFQLSEFGVLKIPRGLGDFLGQIFALIPLSAAVALLGVVLAVNYLPFIFLEAFLKAAATHNPDPRGHIFFLVRELSPADATAMSLLLLPVARRYALWLKGFLLQYFGEREWKQESWSWLVLGLPRMNKDAQGRMLGPFLALVQLGGRAIDRTENALERMLPRFVFQIICAVAPAILSLLGLFVLVGVPFALLRVFAQEGGFIGIVLMKAFLELWIERGAGPLADTSTPSGRT